MRFNICLMQLFLLLSVGQVQQPVFAQPVAFVQDGALLVLNQGSSQTLSIRDSRASVKQQHQVSEYWGTVGDSHLLVTLQPDASRDVAEEHDHHCSTHSAGESAWLLNTDGTLDIMLCNNVLRAYPSPVGNRVALISPNREISIWHNDACTTISTPGPVSNVGWSPDGSFLVVSAYPPGWTQGAASEPSTTAEFLRLQNANLHLFDVEQMKFVSQLSSDPGTEYGPFFSPDGKSLYYTWVHLTDDQGGLMRLNLDADDGTTASAPAVQLTYAGNDSGEIPLGRVATYVWRDNDRQLVFESGLPDGSGEIWVMTAQGQNANRVAAGRKPQPVGDSAIMFMGSNGKSESFVPEVLP